MRRYAFTGPSRFTSADEELVREHLRTLPSPDEITTGGCAGLDTFVALLAPTLWPTARRRIVAPCAPWSEVVPDGTELVLAPAGPDPYRLRNERMLDFGDELVAVLRRPWFYRSGEWMTVNIARRREIRIAPIILAA